jgi:GH24 family phage-related lysozyme (muramidase)
MFRCWLVLTCSFWQEGYGEIVATFDPLAEYDTAQAAAIMSVSEAFLLGLLKKAVPQNIVKIRPGWKIIGSDISRLGKVFHRQIEGEQHNQAFLRVRRRDEAALQERLQGGETDE